MSIQNRAADYIEHRGPELERMTNEELLERSKSLLFELMAAGDEIRAIRAVLHRRQTPAQVPEVSAEDYVF